MIDWIPLNPSTAPDEIEENMYLIVTNERVISATHDAMNKWFYYDEGDHQVIISYRYITHYAEFDFPIATKSKVF